MYISSQVSKNSLIIVKIALLVNPDLLTNFNPTFFASEPFWFKLLNRLLYPYFRDSYTPVSVHDGHCSTTHTYDTTQRPRQISTPVW